MSSFRYCIYIQYPCILLCILLYLTWCSFRAALLGIPLKSQHIGTAWYHPWRIVCYIIVIFNTVHWDEGLVLGDRAKTIDDKEDGEEGFHTGGDRWVVFRGIVPTNPPPPNTACSHGMNCSQQMLLKLKQC